MLRIGKEVLSALLLVLIAAAPLGCVNINKQPDNQRKTEVNVGGEHGVTVDHDKGDKSNNN